MKVVLHQGDRLTVEVEDGEFVIEYGAALLTVTASMPDSSGREGEIYCEGYALPTEFVSCLCPKDACYVQGKCSRDQAYGDLPRDRVECAEAKAIDLARAKS